MATPPAAIGPIGRACGAGRRPTVKPAPDARGASWTAAGRTSAAWGRELPWTTAGGRALARVWSRAREAPGPRRRPGRPPAANRRSRGRGAAAPALSSWDGARRAPVCSGRGAWRPASPRIGPGGRWSIRADHPVLCWGPSGAGVPRPLSPASSRRAGPRGGVSAPASAWIVRSVGPWSGRVDGGRRPSTAGHDPAGAQRAASMTHAWPGGNRRPGPPGLRRRPERPGPTREGAARGALTSTRRGFGPAR